MDNVQEDRKGAVESERRRDREEGGADRKASDRDRQRSRRQKRGNII